MLGVNGLAPRFCRTSNDLAGSLFHEDAQRLAVTGSLAAGRDIVLVDVALIAEAPPRDGSARVPGNDRGCIDFGGFGLGRASEQTHAEKKIPMWFDPRPVATGGDEGEHRTHDIPITLEGAKFFSPRGGPTGAYQAGREVYSPTLASCRTHRSRSKISENTSPDTSRKIRGRSGAAPTWPRSSGSRVLSPMPFYFRWLSRLATTKTWPRTPMLMVAPLALLVVEKST